MPFPDNTTLIDDFNRANAAVDAGAGADIWDGIGIAAAVGALTVTSNRLATASGSQSRCIDATLGPDLDVFMTVATALTGTDYVFMAARVTDAGTATWDGYGLIYIHGTGWQIRRYLNGANVGAIGATLAAPVLAAGDAFGFLLRGPILEAHHKPSAGTWSMIMQRSDTNITVAGRFGIEMSPTGTYDDLSGGTVIAQPTVAMTFKPMGSYT